jgi:hypothetical protein
MRLKSGPVSAKRSFPRLRIRRGVKVSPKEATIPMNMAQKTKDKPVDRSLGIVDFIAILLPGRKDRPSFLTIRTPPYPFQELMILLTCPLACLISRIRWKNITGEKEKP